MKKYRSEVGNIGVCVVDDEVVNVMASIDDEAYPASIYDSKYLEHHPELVMPEFKDAITLENILEIFDLEIAKNVKNKKSVFDFEKNKMQNISSILDNLKRGEVCLDKYNIFTITDPKLRLVMSMSVRDKLINHFVSRYILERNLTKFLSDANCATRKGMGTDYARKKVREYVNILKNKYGRFYILKIDISKYFYSIDHDILKKLIKPHLSEFEYDIMCKIIDSTNESYVNEEILKSGKDLPIYEHGRGLPIGNVSSQFLSIFYLYKLDHYIEHDLGLKYYIRYMDDFIIMSEDKNKLIDALDKIQSILSNEYKLNTNKKKTFITDSKTGFTFLGQTIRVIDNKTVISISRANIERIKKKLKRTRWLLDNGYISHYQAFCSIMNYSYSYKTVNKRRMDNLISRYFYGE